MIAQLEVAALLEQANEAQNERARFYSAASHDLRQPVHALGLYAALLPNATELGERREIERRLGECATSLNRQFDAILGVSEADRAIERSAPRVVAVKGILDAIAAHVLPDAEEKGINLKCVPTRLHVLADVDVLERVLLNLASNAVRYTRSGGVLLGARRAGSAVRLVVADTGIGIAPDQRTRIFEDFYQVANRARRREDGLGLGLSIVQRLAHAMAWTIELSSQLGRGSIFSVTVPGAARADALPPIPLEFDRDELAAFGVASRFSPVIIVDDDPLVRDAMTRVLAHWQAQAAICASGDEAVAALAGRDPGERWCALVDFRLGDEDGLAVARRLLALTDPPRVYMTSGDIDALLEQRCAASGLSLLPKPIQPVRLRALLTAPLVQDVAVA